MLLSLSVSPNTDWFAHNFFFFHVTHIFLKVIITLCSVYAMLCYAFHSHNSTYIILLCLFRLRFMKIVSPRILSYNYTNLIVNMTRPEIAKNSHNVSYLENQPLSYRLEHWEQLNEIIISSRFLIIPSKKEAIWE